MRMLVLALVLAAVACGGKSSSSTTPTNQPVVEAPPPAEEPVPPAASTEVVDEATFQALMQQALAMFKGMGDAADQAAGDCGKLADSLSALLDSNAAFLATTKKYKDNADMDQRAEAWMEAHKDEMMPPVMKLATAGQKCSGDVKFQAVMERFNAIGG